MAESERTAVVESTVRRVLLALDSAAAAEAALTLTADLAAATASTLAGLFVITAAVPAETIDQASARGYWAPVIAVTWMLVLAVMPLVIPHFARRRFDQVVALLCAVCLTPTMLALWAAYRGGGRWLPITGWVLSTLDVELVLRRAVRDGRTASPEPAPED